MKKEHKNADTQIIMIFRIISGVDINFIEKYNAIIK